MLYNQYSGIYRFRPVHLATSVLGGLYLNAMLDDPMLLLSPKRRRFVEAYLQAWNAAEAARQAGYRGRANMIGERLMRDERIQAAIAARIKQVAMAADEVLVRLAQQARNESAMYVRKDGTIDLGRLIADGKSHLIKATKWDRQGRLVVEFYDAQAALVQLGRAHRLFVDQVDMTQHTDQVAVTIYLPDNGRGSGDRAED